MKKGKKLDRRSRSAFGVLLQALHGNAAQPKASVDKRGSLVVLKSGRTGPFCRVIGYIPSFKAQF